MIPEEMCCKRPNLGELQFNVFALSVLTLIGFSINTAIFYEELGLIIWILARGDQLDGNSTQTPSDQLKQRSISVGLISLPILMVLFSILLLLSTKDRGGLALLLALPFYFTGISLWVYFVYLCMEKALDIIALTIRVGSGDLRAARKTLLPNDTQIFVTVLILVLLSYLIASLHMYIKANFKLTRESFRKWRNGRRVGKDEESVVEIPSSDGDDEDEEEDENGNNEKGESDDLDENGNAGERKIRRARSDPDISRRRRFHERSPRHGRRPRPPLPLPPLASRRFNFTLPPFRRFPHPPMMPEPTPRRRHRRRRIIRVPRRKPL